MRCEFLLVLALCVATSQARSTRMRMLERVLDFLETRDDEVSLESSTELDDAPASCICPEKFGDRPSEGFCRPLECYTIEEIASYVEDFKVENDCGCPEDLECPSGPPPRGPGGPGGPGGRGPGSGSSSDKGGDGPDGPPEGQCPKLLCCILEAGDDEEKRQGGPPPPTTTAAARKREDDLDDLGYISGEDCFCPPPGPPPPGSPELSSEELCSIDVCEENAPERKRAHAKRAHAKLVHLKRQEGPRPPPEEGSAMGKREDSFECVEIEEEDCCCPVGPPPPGSASGPPEGICSKEICDANRPDERRQTKAKRAHAKRVHLKRQDGPPPPPEEGTGKREDSFECEDIDGEDCCCPVGPPPGPPSSGSASGPPEGICSKEICDANRPEKRRQTKALINLMRSLFEN